MEKEKIPQELIIPASEHPKAFEPAVLILNIVMCCLGAIIGLELIVRTGVTPNTSIVGALFAILISRIPIAFLQKYRSVTPPEPNPDLYIRRNLLRCQLSDPAHRYPGCHGASRINVSNADRRFPGHLYRCNHPLQNL